MSAVSTELFLQQDQPAGVPPLPLTGERTLPDVPAENYWFRRHLAVYEWIARRTAGQRVLDMACGEGYGSALIARGVPGHGGARSVVGVDANPEAHEHARLRYVAPHLRFDRALVETYMPADGELFDAVVFLQTIEHVQDPVQVLSHFAELLAPGGVVYVSTPNLLTLAPAGAEKSSNPWHLKEYRADEFTELCASVFASVRVLGLFHAGKLRAHELALALGWDRIHSSLGITDLFYDWFTPAIAERDFVLRDGPLDRSLDFIAVCQPEEKDVRS